MRLIAGKISAAVEFNFAQLHSGRDDFQEKPAREWDRRNPTELVGIPRGRNYSVAGFPSG